MATTVSRFVSYRGLPSSSTTEKLCHLRAQNVLTSANLRRSMASCKLPPCNVKPQDLSRDPRVPSFEKTVEIRKKNIHPSLFTYYRKPLYITQGNMQWLWDHKGERYLDMFGGIVTVSVGHCHPRVVAAAERQIRTLWHTTNIYLNPAVHVHAEKLVAKLPGDLKVVYFVNSGSEANDLAIQMARLHTGHWEVITLRNAYHGTSPHVIGTTALSTWRPNVASSFGMIHTMNADPYRGVWGGQQCRDGPIQVKGRKCDCTSGEECQAGVRYADQLQEVIQYSCEKQGPAAFIAESIQGVGGTVQFPKNYLKEAYKRVRAAGGLCIADEVQTGFGRLGSHFWGFEAHGVQPDIVTTAKGIANGFPMAAVVTTPQIAASLTHALHFNTFGGNPIGCAVGSEVLDIIEEEKLQARCAELGTRLLKGLGELRDRYPAVGDVRGKGLMIGVEMVDPQNPTKPLAGDKVIDVWEGLRDRGVLFGKGGLYGNVFRVKPPMCITKEDVDFTVNAFEEVLQKYTK